MSNREKAELTFKMLQRRKAKRKDIQEKDYKDYICKMFQNRKKKWGLRFGGYKR